MKIEQAQATTLFTMAIECMTPVKIGFMRDSVGDDGLPTQESHIHKFDCGDLFLVTVLSRVFMQSHNAPNEIKDEIGEFTPAADFIDWEFASVFYKRFDGVVHIPAEELNRFQFVRLYNDAASPTQRVIHLCGPSCWYGAACKTNLARTPDEISDISF